MSAGQYGRPGDRHRKDRPGLSGPKGRNRGRADGVIDLVPTPDRSPSPATLSAAGAPAPGGSPSKRPPAVLKAVDTDTTAGIIFGIGAYGLWGLMPLYFFLLQPAGLMF